jgi:glycosyltransferase involved in cell wall biosynthesis
MNGHRLRTWALLRALVGDGHRVTLVTFATADEEATGRAELERLCEAVDVVAAPPDGVQPLRRLIALTSRLPFGVWRFRSPKLSALVRRYLDAGGIDAILCDGVYNVQNMPSAPGVPLLLNKDDVAHVILRRYLDLERDPVRRLYGEVEYRRVRRWEALACRRMNAVLVCSAEDRRILSALCPGVPMPIVPNAIDTGHYQPRTGEDLRTVVFQGGMDWHPNSDAVEYFIRRVLPDLRRRVPDVVFRVVGRSASAQFKARMEALGPVCFTGTVPDMRDEIARATVCVVPLRIGSGTRLKILEAAAMARAIVSTPLGAEGLQFRDGDEIVLREHPEEFAAAVAELLADPARRERLGRTALRRVRKDYSFPALHNALQGALAAAAGRMVP